MKCAQCGTENDARMNFCGECGSRLTPAFPDVTPAPVSATADSAVPNGPVPDSPYLDGERRLVTILFADIPGFTSLAERMDPERLRDLMNACFDHLVPCVEEYGGTVDKFMGDAVMALFGAPVAHDNDAERAIRTALDMRRALPAFTSSAGVDLSLHIGINTGLVLAGSVGGGNRMDYSVMGDAVNVAARLEEEAGPGEILIGPDTRRLAGQVFLCESAGAIRVRGRGESLAVWRVVRERGTATEERGGPPGRALDSPLVGREKERAQFEGTVARTLAGEGGVLFVLGEAGLGKSRLTTEVRRSSPTGVVWLEGRSLSFGKDLSYLPFREILQRAAGTSADDADQERLVKLALLVERLFGDDAEVVLSVLATLLSLPMSDELEERVRYLEGEAMGRQIARSMRLLLRRLAEERPLVLVLEDAHWLDPSSLAFLRELLPLTREVPLRVCLAGRPEADSPTAALRALATACCGERVEEINLAPLGAEQIRGLVHNLVGGDELPRSLREAIGARAEGNPLFVEEVIRALVDLGGLVPYQSGGLRVMEKAGEITIPDTLQGVITGRIDRLFPGPRDALRTAAVIGRSFSQTLLAGVVSDPSGLAGDLALLREREFVRVLRTQPQPEYSFKHVLIQEAAYEGLLLRRRREIHLRVATAIEQLHADRLEEVYGLLAYHYTKAEAWDKSQGYLLEAGRQAGRIAADPETLAHFERALDAHLRAHGGTWGSLVSNEGVEWFLEWANSLAEERRLGVVVGPVKTFYENVSSALGPRDPRVLAVATVLGRAYLQGGSPHEAEAILESVLGFQDEADGCDDIQVVGTLMVLGTARLYQDNYPEAEAALVRARDLVRRATDLNSSMDACWVYLNLSALWSWLGRWEEARDVMNEALARPELQVGRAQVLVLSSLSSLSWLMGEYEQAERHARTGLDQAAHPLHRAGALDMLGLVRRAQGALAEAEEHIVAAVKAAQPLGPTDVLAQIVGDLAEARLQVGRLEEAQTAAVQALTLNEDVSGTALSWTIPPRWTLAGVALARGQTDEAERLFAECEAISADTDGGLPWLQPEMLYRKGQLRRLQGREDEADGLVREACRLLDERRRGSPHPRAEAMRAEWAEGVPTL
jgi:class 3 adenylate cyclase/tetratricopeptide (TPR) repeat protein